MGDYVFNVTVMLWVVKVIALHQTWAPAAASGVLIAAAVPAVAIGPFCGVFIDRWDRRRTMLVADAARTVLIASLVPLAFPSVAGHVPRTAQLGIVYVLVAAAACFSQFFGPSRFAMLGVIVSKPELPKASGILQSTSYTAAIIGPPLAAPLFVAAGAQWAIVPVAGVASRARFARRCAIGIRRPWTRRPLNRDRQLLGRRGRTRSRATSLHSDIPFADQSPARSSGPTRGQAGWRTLL